MQLTVTVITRNEAANIDAAIASVAWADEIVVVDSGSTDDPVERARRHGARVEVRPWAGYGAQKNYAASIASHDWILSIDADERVTPELAQEITTLLTTEPPRRGYRVSRLTHYLGRWIRSTDWYPDYQLRLYDRRAGSWTTRRIHESYALNGVPGVLRQELQHYPYRDVSDHLRKIDNYTTLSAEQWIEEGRRVSLVEIVVHPAFAFMRNYILRGGIRDGSPGLITSVLNAYYVFLKLAKTWEKQQRGSMIEARGPNEVRGSAEPRSSNVEPR